MKYIPSVELLKTSSTINYYTNKVTNVLSWDKLGELWYGTIDAPVNREGYTKLHIAVQNDDYAAAASLISQGANPNKRTYELPDSIEEIPILKPIYWSCLHFAVSRKFRGMVELILSNGKYHELDRIGNVYGAALLIAIENNHCNMLELLIEKAGEIKWSGIKRPILHYAIETRNLDIVRLLIEKGADIDDYDKATELSVLHYAVSTQSIEFLDLLFKHNINLILASTRKPIILYALSAKFKSYEVIEFLLKNGADPNQIHLFNKSSALLIAAISEDKKMVDLLYKYGANLDLITSDEFFDGPVLNLLAKRCKFEMCEQLLELGANPDTQDQSGKTFRCYNTKLAKKYDDINVAKYDAGNTSQSFVCKINQSRPSSPTMKM